MSLQQIEARLKSSIHAWLARKAARQLLDAAQKAHQACTKTKTRCRHDGNSESYSQKALIDSQGATAASAQQPSSTSAETKDFNNAKALYEAVIAMDSTYADARLGCAHLLRMHARCQQDLDQTVAHLKAVVDTAHAAQACASASSSTLMLPITTEQRRQALQQLALLMCQAGRDAEAQQYLLELGSRYRLSSKVLHYPLSLRRAHSSSDFETSDVVECSGTGETSQWGTTRVVGTQAVQHSLLEVSKQQAESVAPVQAAIHHASQSAAAHGNAIAPSSKGRESRMDATPEQAEHTGQPDSSQYVHAVDNALPPALLTHMQEALHPASCFWSEHCYDCESSPYFSYVHCLGAPATSSLDQLIQHVHGLVRQHFPAVAEAGYAEWWAHCRPHASGHQLHFDSDNEGMDGIRNPIVSTVVYITGDIGGPTFVTDQGFTDQHLARHGWMVFPQQNRIAMFDGRYLHGVIPGRGCSPNPGERRVTFMIAFWRDITVRPSEKGEPGSARPFPGAGTQSAAAMAAAGHTWPQLFGLNVGGWGTCTAMPAPVHGPVSPVWEDVLRVSNHSSNCAAAVSGKGPENVGHGKMPGYEVCFQGF